MDSLVLEVFEGLQARDWMIATAESCTGGMIGARLTDVSGASVYVDRGFITYSNQAKMEMLGVSAALLDTHGAVSAQVAEAMAKGALKESRAGLAVSVTGVAGPGGGTPDKPVGLVHIGVATWEQVFLFEYRFTGNRQVIRNQTVEAALTCVRNILMDGSIANPVPPTALPAP